MKNCSQVSTSRPATLTMRSPGRIPALSAADPGSIWPTTYYMHASKGVFTKGLGFDLLAQDLVVLACIIPILWAVSALALEKQEK